MRNAAPGPEFPLTALRGSNQSGMRAYNERLVLSLLQRHGALARAEIARATGLSAQTVSVIIRALEEDGLLLRDAPQRGRVGQPSVPMRLNPQGAFFLGLKVGRRSVEMVLANVAGKVLHRRAMFHSHPDPDQTVAFAIDAAASLAEALPPRARSRIGGLGIAIPFHLWSWSRALGVPQETMAAWRDRDIAAEIAAGVGYPVELQNDASAACGAELVFGSEPVPANFVHFFIGFFIGGGLVLNGTLFTGATGNAAALGSMPVPGDREPRQLIDCASLSVLEDRLEARGAATEALWAPPRDWDFAEPDLTDWISEAAGALAFSITAGAAVLDLDAALIDGHLPPEVRDRLVEATRHALDDFDFSGMLRPVVRAGTVGPDARALGAASLPLAHRYLV